MFSISLLIFAASKILGWITYYTIAQPKVDEIAYDITSYLQANELYVNEDWLHNYVISRKQSGYIKDFEDISITYRQPSNDRRFSVEVTMRGNYLNGYALPKTAIVSYNGVNYGKLPDSTVWIWYDPSYYNPEEEKAHSHLITNDEIYNEPHNYDAQNNLKDSYFDLEDGMDLSYLGTDFYFTEEEKRLFEYVDKTCIACHGSTWQGLAGPSLYNLNQKYSEDEILDIIMNGKGTMPRGMLDEQNSIALSKYLYNLPDLYDYSNGR
ncbi:hypothetical protein BKP45_06640 [Anaerobacillus alkalidiazotrophicus]|uniref:Cytochrome c domain-containing protein n=1 Tax=Anaerobacillus alkalidiazotrophicus TaxID=472963 RepID=A0A1S2MC53_9BACI|nr:cytochrome c [Anaerobacillus alkalidiazotrophicus]OIJ22311.1 hypothetical protein BKP45_06640 [Anaerobacillus alkalidiazotrophicus]